MFIKKPNWQYIGQWFEEDPGQYTVTTYFKIVDVIANGDSFELLQLSLQGNKTVVIPKVHTGSTPGLEWKNRRPINQLPKLPRLYFPKQLNSEDRLWIIKALAIDNKINPKEIMKLLHTFGERDLIKLIL